MVHQVFARYVLERAPSWSEELAGFLMVWLTMLGAAAVLRGGGHISVTVLTDRLPPRLLRIALALRDVVMVATCGVLAGGDRVRAHQRGRRSRPHSRYR